MFFADDKLTGVISKIALVVALIVGLSPPIGYGLVVYAAFSDELAFKAKVKAAAFTGLITSNPELWLFAENRMQGLLVREPVPLEGEAVVVYDDRGAVVTQAGVAPAAPFLGRTHALYDATRVAGRLEVRASLRPLILDTLLAAVIGLLLGSLTFVTMRSFPLRALRRAAEALFEQKERAEVTLHSIGDAVLTVDAQGLLVYLNPVAEALTGRTLDRALNHPLSDMLQLVDAATQQPVPSAIAQALAEDRIVATQQEIDLIRADGGRVGVEERAAPIHDVQGRVIGAVLVLRDVSTVRDQARQRYWEAAHDSLTGLANRREFERLVALAVDSARSGAMQHVVCFLDLDRFKVVNDACGHAAGDELLKRIADMLGSSIRASDTLARLGGDEFGLLLIGCSLDRAVRICADMLATLGDYRFQWEGRLFTVGVSIGVSRVDGQSSAAENLAAADTACYLAKEQGRNRVCTYRQGDEELESRRRQVGWVERINAALAENRFVLFQQTYLPLAAHADAAVHLEVLLRMVAEDGSLIPPASFLPAAERCNLMPAIDRWVLRRVFANYRELVAARGGGPLVCAINLSATTINSEGFFEYVMQQVREWEIPAGAICFEITESSAINNLHHAVEFMRLCKALGILFALDDFGTGLRSFGYLKDLPVDYLKIDGSFVQNLNQNAIDRAMTEAINRIGHIMGIKTIAEYAETEAIIEELRSIGVDYAQGYGVCRPQPLLDIDARLQGTAAALREGALS